MEKFRSTRFSRVDIPPRREDEVSLHSTQTTVSHGPLLVNCNMFGKGGDRRDRLKGNREKKEKHPSPFIKITTKLIIILSEKLSSSSENFFYPFKIPSEPEPRLGRIWGGANAPPLPKFSKGIQT